MNKKGFTLTEVLVGMTILTIAIVTATSMLVGIIRSNKSNVDTLKAYYFAMEGLELVRNIRDTNWLHNKDWLSKNSTSLWGASFVKSPVDAANQNGYLVSLKENFSSVLGKNLAFPDLTGYAPFDVDNFVGQKLKLKNGEEAIFDREISIFEYPDCGLADCEDFARVESRVMWEDGSQKRELKLNVILTNWKNGVL